MATYKNSYKSGGGDEEGESEPWLWEEGVLVEVRERLFCYCTISCMPIDVI